MVDMREHPELSVTEKRRFGLSARTRAEALRRFRAGDSRAALAQSLRLNEIQVRYLLMQERVEDGEVPRLAANSEAICEALECGGEYGTPPWVACRAGVTLNIVKRVQRSQAGQRRGHQHRA